MIGVRLGVGHHFSGGFDSSASAFFTATGITGTTEQQAVNTLVTSLKSAGLWSKMKAVYPFVTDQRNLASYSEDFSNAAWSKTDTTVTANATTAPDGTTTADRLIESATTNTHRIFQSITTSGTNTYSIYVKYNGRQYFGIRFFADASNYSSQLFDVQNGVIGNKLELGITSTATMTSVGNGWYRCSISANVSSINMLAFLSTTNTVNDVVGNIYLGDGTSGVFIWGAQAELGTLSTYQPQLGSAQSAISNQFKYNLVNPVDSDAAFRGVFNGGWTFSNNGATPNGTNGYMDTKFNNQGNWSSSSNGSMGFVSRTNTNPVAQCDMGSGIISSGNNSSTIYSRYSGDVFYSGLNATTVAPGDSNTSSIGFFVTSRLSSTEYTRYKRGSSTINRTNTDIIGANPNSTIFLGAGNAGGIASNYSDRQFDFCFIGDGLTQTQVDNYWTALQTFNQTLNR